MPVQAELEQRARRYGSNTVRPPKEVTLLELIVEALQVRPFTAIPFFPLCSASLSLASPSAWRYARHAAVVRAHCAASVWHATCFGGSALEG